MVKVILWTAGMYGLTAVTAMAVACVISFVGFLISHREGTKDKQMHLRRAA